MLSEPRLTGSTKAPVASYVVGGTAVQPLENVLAVSGREAMQQLIGTHHTHLGV